MLLIEGYGRSQGIVYRRGDRRFEDRTIDEIVSMLRSLACPARGRAEEGASSQSDCIMVNRNQGSGTRILIDRLLAGARPRGYAVQATNHNAVAAAVAQGRADWGLAIESVARANGLGFLPYQDEQYDFVIAKSRRERPAVRAFVELLAQQTVRERFLQFGFRLHP
jgi:putative molybdopterin biosynthesis protein